MFKITKKIYFNFIIKRYFQKDAKVGICFDVDGVIGAGPTIISGAQKAIKKLLNDQKEWKIPVAFITNSSRLRNYRTEYLKNLLEVEIEPWQVIQAPSALEVLSEHSKKFFLAVEQHESKQLAHENGFTNVCTLEEISQAYPLLDMVSFWRKMEILEPTLQLPPIEGILVLGEPIFWERALQLIVDLLRTHGTPTHLPTTSHKQIPLIVCNFDIEYQSRVTIPRFGNGSFLVCLESVYEKITHRKLVYDVILGKPAELTMRYGEYVLQRAMKKRHGGSIETMYMVGDSHKVDVVASNRYQKYIKKMQHYKNRGLCEREAILKVNKSLPHFRKIPPHPYFIEHPQQVTKMVALLVKTGIYKETDVLGQGGLGDANNFLSHDSILEVPQGIFDDALAAVNYVIQVEKLA